MLTANRGLAFAIVLPRVLAPKPPGKPPSKIVAFVGPALYVASYLVRTIILRMQSKLCGLALPPAPALGQFLQTSYDFLSSPNLAH